LASPEVFKILHKLARKESSPNLPDAITKLIQNLPF
jgi:hypothetical protein